MAHNTCDTVRTKSVEQRLTDLEIGQHEMIVEMQEIQAMMLQLLRISDLKLSTERLNLGTSLQMKTMAHVTNFEIPNPPCIHNTMRKTMIGNNEENFGGTQFEFLKMELEDDVYETYQLFDEMPQNKFKDCGMVLSEVINEELKEDAVNGYHMFDEMSQNQISNGSGVLGEDRLNLEEKCMSIDYDSGIMLNEDYFHLLGNELLVKRHPEMFSPPPEPPPNYNHRIKGALAIFSGMHFNSLRDAFHGYTLSDHVLCVNSTYHVTMMAGRDEQSLVEVLKQEKIYKPVVLVRITEITFKNLRVAFTTVKGMMIYCGASMVCLIESFRWLAKDGHWKFRMTVKYLWCYLEGKMMIFWKKTLKWEALNCLQKQFKHFQRLQNELYFCVRNVDHLDELKKATRSEFKWLKLPCCQKNISVCELAPGFDWYFTANILKDNEYQVFIGGILSKLRGHFPRASFIIFNFGHGNHRRHVANILSDSDLKILQIDKVKGEGHLSSIATFVEGRIQEVCEDACSICLEAFYDGYLCFNVIYLQLYDLFNQVGQVVFVRVCRDLITQRSLGYVYVNNNNSNDAARNMETLPLKKKSIRVMYSNRPPSIGKSGTTNTFVKNLNETIDNRALHDQLRGTAAEGEGKAQRRIKQCHIILLLAFKPDLEWILITPGWYWDYVERKESTWWPSSLKLVINRFAGEIENNMMGEFNRVKLRDKEIVSEEKRSQELCPPTPEEFVVILQALGFDKKMQTYIAYWNVVPVSCATEEISEEPSCINEQSTDVGHEVEFGQSRSLGSENGIHVYLSNFYAPTVQASCSKGHQNISCEWDCLSYRNTNGWNKESPCMYNHCVAVEFPNGYNFNFKISCGPSSSKIISWPDVGNVEQHWVLVTSLKTSLIITNSTSATMPILDQIMASPSSSYVENTILLLMRCKHFQIDDLEAFLHKMLLLVFFHHKSIYEAFVNAFIIFYISKNTLEAVKDLLNLVIVGLWE